MKRTKRFTALLTALSLLTPAIPYTMPVYAEETPPAYDAAASGQSLSGLMDTFRPADQNYMYSPYSIKTALALTANGADDAAKAELLQVIGTDTIEEYNERARALAEKYSGNTNVELKSANSLWINTDNAPGLKFSEDYLSLVKKFFNAEAGTVTNADAVQTVNSWCSDNTNEKITEIIDDPGFAAIIANALYFKGDWENPFPDWRTEKGIFTDRDGRRASVDFMHNDAHHFNGFYEDEELKVLELDYKGRDTAMYLVLHKGEAANAVRHTDITRYMDKTKSESVIVSIPKFKIDYFNSYYFPAAFRQIAVFDKMFEGAGLLAPDELRHKTFINVDEYGTEAAAVTIVIWESMAENTKTFTADRPFEFFIADKATKEVLFAGEYAYADDDDYINEEPTTEISTDPTTESTTEPTTNSELDHPIEARWYEPGIAGWAPFANEDLDRNSVCDYTVKLYDINDNLLDTRTVTFAREKYLENGGVVIQFANNLCSTDFRDILSEHGEGLYRFTVEYDYGTEFTAEDFVRSDTSGLLFYTDSKDHRLHRSFFSEKPTDYIAAAGEITIPGRDECIYRLSDPEAAELTDSSEIYDMAYIQGSSGITGDPTYKQFIFRPTKPGIVTLELIHEYNAFTPQTAYLDNDGIDRRTYLIDNDLKVHVYEPSKGYLVGDADNDGILSAADSAHVLQKALISTFETPVERADKENYTITEGNTVYDRAAVLDINKNGNIDSDDAAKILQAALTGQWY